MPYQVIELNCPGCGARVSISQKICEYCKEPVIISSFNSVNSLPLPLLNKYTNEYRNALKSSPYHVGLNKALGLCFLKLKLYEKAIQAFEKAMEEDCDDAELYFYAALCLLNGKKPFLCSREVIDKMISYINAANMIEPRGIFYYFLAYIKYDYFERKYLNCNPNYLDCLNYSEEMGTPVLDRKILFDFLGLARPSGF